MRVASEHFTEAARAAGIDRDTHVVICDASGTNGFYFGGRAWWMFYVSETRLPFLIVSELR